MTDRPPSAELAGDDRQGPGLRDRWRRLTWAAAATFLGRSAPGRAIAADRRWLVPIVLGAYVLFVTWTWEFPNWQGIPFPPVWVGAALSLGVAWRRLRLALGPLAVTAIVVVSAMVLTDITLFWTQGLRDLEIYLKAGDRWRTGAPVYLSVPLAARPEDLSNYPFLYPPLTLPLFGALASLPFPVAAAGWVATSLAAVVAGCRWIGLDWRWTLIVLAWPPVAQGIYVGNVAVPLFALFAAAAWRPALLVVPPIFKIYSGIVALWLLRREHWRSLALGMGAVAVIGLATLPLTGIGAWSQWLGGLQAYQVSQRLLPDYLYGFGLARYLPLAVFGVLGLAVTLAALRAREGREQLSRLGVATIVASPSLFSHGWLVALPALVRLDTPWFWLALGLTACSPGLAWFVALGLVVASWSIPALRKRPGADPWHPLGTGEVPWSATAALETRSPRFIAVHEPGR